MCAQKQDVETKIDRLIASMERLTAALVSVRDTNKEGIEDNTGSLGGGALGFDRVPRDRTLKADVHAVNSEN